MKSARCPNCSSNMDQRFYDRKPHGKVELDICFACHGIWFDQYESAALTPGSVIALFTAIREHEGQAQRMQADTMRCPGCKSTLAQTHDIQRTNRFTYHRCPSGHGRYTSFFHFLREKNFVRSLSPAEIAQLRVRVAQVKCSSCGGPVSLERDARCGYCQAPLSILDADAIGKTIAELDVAERKRVTVDPQAVIDGLLAGKQVEKRINATERGHRLMGRIPESFAGRGQVGSADVADLVGDAISMLLRD